MTWIELARTVGAAFLASLVECVETATILLAVGTVRGWRSAFADLFTGLVALLVLVLASARRSPSCRSGCCNSSSGYSSCSSGCAGSARRSSARQE